MRILFCNFEYPPLGGGGGVINALLAEELARRHEVAVLTSEAAGFQRDPRAGGVRIVGVPVAFRRRAASASMLSMLSYVLRGPRVGRDHLKQHSYDIINTHFVLPSGPVGDRLARGLDVPNILSVHGGDLYDPSKFTSPHRHAILRGWIRRLARRANAVVGQSKNTLENLHRYYTPEIPGIRIPLGIRKPPGGLATREAHGLGADEVLLATVGRVVARKAVHQLIEMMSGLQDLPVRLLVIGSGPLVPSLREQCQGRGLADRVRFLGHVEEEDKFRILRMCDLFVSTSQHEGFGLVFLEGMACGLPVVCYDHGGQTDFLVDGETGNLIRLNDLDRFTRCCRSLARDAEQRRRMGDRNLVVVEEFFIDRCAAKYEAVFEEALHRHRAGQPGR